uniref:Uncharacterized protein n=1 Tax=Plectus sambesii TaxID=2011161 RepID=A0A914USF5_9BILA
MTTIDQNDDVRDIVASLPGADHRDINILIFGSINDEQIMHEEGWKRGWKLCSTVVEPDDVQPNAGDFPSDHLHAAPATHTYFNHLAVLLGLERVVKERWDLRQDLKSLDACFEMKIDEDAMGSDGEAFMPKSFLIWPLNRATKCLGLSKETIHFCSKMFMQFLKNRSHAKCTLAVGNFGLALTLA